ncbi:MAG: hypothetical protein J0L78_06040 [Planctomycetes bacterium]|nr:hypothetical protein [Planctomycetota bacterium]
MNENTANASLITANYTVMWQKMYASLIAISQMLNFRDQDSLAYTLAIRDHARRIFSGSITDHLPAGVLDGGGPMTAKAAENAQAVLTFLASLTRIESKTFTESAAADLAKRSADLADWIEGVLRPVFGDAWLEISHTQIHDTCEAWRPRTSELAARSIVATRSEGPRELWQQQSPPSSHPTRQSRGSHFVDAKPNEVWRQGYWFSAAVKKYSKGKSCFQLSQLKREADSDPSANWVKRRGNNGHRNYEVGAVCRLLAFQQYEKFLKQAVGDNFVARRRQQRRKTRSGAVTGSSETISEDPKRAETL